MGMGMQVCQTHFVFVVVVVIVRVFLSTPIGLGVSSGLEVRAVEGGEARLPIYSFTCSLTVRWSENVASL